MTPSVTVQRAGPEHCLDADRLFRGYLAFYGKVVCTDAADAFIAERLRLQDSVILLAGVDGHARGFMQLYPSFASLSLAPSWILNDLYVEPAARGRGVARALMQAARELALANGAAEIVLQTARDNNAAQALYRQLGYRRDDQFLVYTLALPGH